VAGSVSRAPVGRLLAGLGLDPVKQMALLRLRARLTVRQFTNEPGRLVGLALSALFFVPVVIAVSVATAFAYVRLPEPWPYELLAAVLTVLWLIWLTMPLIAFSINESLDLTRLLIYPLSTRDLTLATLLGALFDFPTYLLIPLFLAIVAGWLTTPLLPVVLIGLVICYGHMILISQLVLVAAGGILRSRRFRDIMLVVASLFGFSCYFTSRGLEWAARWLVNEGVTDVRPLLVLQWLPTGAPARAVERAAAGRWIETTFWLLYAVTLLLLVIWAWRRLFLRVVTGRGFLLTRPPRQRPDATPQQAGRSQRRLPRWLTLIPHDVRVLFWNELRASWRVPQRRIGFLQGVLAPFFFGGFFLLNSRNGTEEMAVPEWAGLILPGYVLLSIWLVSMNMLGWEGKGLSTLLLTPMPRQRIFIGKGLGQLLLMELPIVVLGIGLTIITRSWFGLAGMVAALGVGACALGVTAVASVLFPYPVNLESVQRQSSFSSGGCMTALANGFLVPVTIGLTALPALTPFLAAIWWNADWLAAAGVVVALAYGAALFGLGTRLAGHLLLQREAEVLEATHLPEGG